MDVLPYSTQVRILPSRHRNLMWLLHRAIRSPDYVLPLLPGLQSRLFLSSIGDP